MPIDNSKTGPFVFITIQPNWDKTERGEVGRGREGRGEEGRGAKFYAAPFPAFPGLSHSAVTKPTHNTLDVASPSFCKVLSKCPGFYTPWFY